MPPRTYIFGGSPTKTPAPDTPTTPSRGRTRRAAASKPAAPVESSPERPGAADDDSDADFHASPSAAADKPKRGRKPSASSASVTTPTKRRPGRPPKTPPSTTTPRRRAVAAAVSAADQSARRKSMRTMMERANGDDMDSDDERFGLARQIYGSSESGDDSSASSASDSATDSGPVTPSRKRARKSTGSSPGRKKRARTTTRDTSPEMPPNMPPHEVYFFHNKPGRAHTGNTTLADIELLTPDEYFALARDLADPHAGDVAFLQALHEESFPQWAFELAEGFSLCLFGMGSKRAVMRRFATFLARRTGGTDEPRNRIVMVNGFARAMSARDLLTTVWASLEMEQRPSSVQPTALLTDVLHTLARRGETLTLVVNSVDAPPMRKAGLQSILAACAASAHVQLVVSADSPDFVALWDAGQRSVFNFAFHDATTLAPFAPPEIDPVDDVHDLLGRTNRRIGGKEGVAFVLKSLTQNAKGLYLLLLAEVLAAMDDGAGTGQAGSGAATENPGIEWRMLFNKAVEAFVCPSSEVAFRQLLKEFHDHQMITSTRDALGTELISTPFRREEMEAILEEIAT
ncbi:hypothetical protein TD95_003241 [Thielaviopsis punctulata]|uniref:Origin recognition complex subunit 2 n=1 Tax=Thielaviopsis punctulata TaxID=72032 RepID=A0A0F4ZC95_9PEZI|nr:hypothetical protein TD95_003241 [Thielaviopsis punctulata]